MKARSTPRNRTLRLASMTAGVTQTYGGYWLTRLLKGEAGAETARRAAHAKAAVRVREELQALRGPAMKLGQALSLHTDLLPEEAIEELTKLQMQAPAMHPSLASAQFKQSLGALPATVFRSFDPEPFAAASLGQVHRAVTREGVAVAVKIQYPGIRDAADADFKLLRRLGHAARLTGHVPDAILTELETQILAETDYSREADNIEYFRQALKPLPFVITPEVLRKYCAEQVLTMTFVPGMHLEAWLATRPGRRLRDLAGARLMELFYFQILRGGALHADPNWGNYLFSPDASIGIVDFGCVKYLEPHAVASLRQLYLYSGSRKSPAFRKVLDARYAAAGKTLPAATHRTLIEFSERFYRQVYPPDAAEQDTFDFGDPGFLRDYMRSATNLMRAKGLHADDLLMARAEIGLYNTLHRLRARVPTSAIVRKYL